MLCAKIKINSLTYFKLFAATNARYSTANMQLIRSKFAGMHRPQELEEEEELENIYIYTCMSLLAAWTKCHTPMAKRGLSIEQLRATLFLRFLLMQLLQLIFPYKNQWVKLHIRK